MLRAFNRAQDYYLSHKAEALKIMSKREGITPEELELALTDGLRVVTAGEQAAYLREGGIQAVLARTAAVLKHTKLLAEPKPLESYFSDRFVPAGP